MGGKVSILDVCTGRTFEQDLDSEQSLGSGGVVPLVQSSGHDRL